MEKRRMAAEVVDLYHGDGAGAAAAERFDLVHREHEVPEDVPEVALSDEWSRGKGDIFWMPNLLWRSGLATSKTEARRLIEQGGVRLDGRRVSDPDAEVAAEELLGHVLQVGRRRFVRFV
jgi:tyrosyl-tRNA synthetase